MRREYFYVIILLFAISGVFFGVFKLINVAYQKEEALITENTLQNVYENEVIISTAAKYEEKLSPNATFALKKIYDECNHFEYKEAELPKELVNLTKQEIEDYYDDWEVEEFSSNKLVLCKEINGYCTEHFVIKLEDDKVKVYRLGILGNLEEYKNTDIYKEYLPDEDIKKLEEGIVVYGEGKLSSVLEDYE